VGYTNQNFYQAGFGGPSGAIEDRVSNPVNETTMVEVIFTTVSTGYRNCIPFTTNNTPLIQNLGTSYGYIGVGAISATLVGYYLTGQIAEILSFNVPLNDNNRQQIEGYLAWKWGFNKSLPEGHPYFLFPPVPTQYQ
jgi:hypothetical protein